MKKQVFIAIGIGLVFILAFAGVKFAQIRAAMAMDHTPPPEAITSIVAAEETWPRLASAVGSVAAVQGATLSAEASGRIAKINFESGQQVERGEILVELDSTVEYAQLEVAEAVLGRAKKAFDRAKGLAANNATSQSNYETAEAAYRGAFAEAEALKAMVGRRRIVAPFAGRTGIRSVNIGDYVQMGSAVVPLHALDRVYLNFSLPQKYLAAIRAGQEIAVKVDSYPNEKFQGKVTAVNPNVDATSRNIDLQATVENKGELLRPGMFAGVELTLPGEDRFVTLPGTAVKYAPYGDSVYVLEPTKDASGKEFKGAREQIVQLGRRYGDRVAVLSGVTPGQEIATSGLFKLRPGAAVFINNNFAPANSLTPQPSDS